MAAGSQLEFWIIGLGIDAIELGGLDQAVDVGSPMAADIGAGE
jgi:hypothetical protein